MTTAQAILRSVVSWHVSSQHKARRNALLASTALAQLSHERREVEEFLVAHAGQRAATRSLPAAPWVAEGT